MQNLQIMGLAVCRLQKDRPCIRKGRRLPGRVSELWCGLGCGYQGSHPEDQHRGVLCHPWLLARVP